jgi:hypothetical protein
MHRTLANMFNALMTKRLDPGLEEMQQKTLIDFVMELENKGFLKRLRKSTGWRRV